MAIKDLLDRFKKGLARTAKLFDVRAWFGRKVDEDFLGELEAKLIRADVGVKAAQILIDRVREAFADKTAGEDLLEFLKQEMKVLLRDTGDRELIRAPENPTVILVVGVNGSGKTTSIAKLAQRLINQEHSLLLGAGDTFRAAAADQLAIWAERSGADIVRGNPGADPASVAHDSCERALAKKTDYLIVDTAGRLHTQTHLMKELEKVRGVITRKIKGAPHETLLVLDGTNGQNAIQQAKVFTEAVQCTGVILTKLDGTAKGGIVVAVRQQTGLPIKYIGIGEGIDDLQPFDPDVFVESLFS